MTQKSKNIKKPYDNRELLSKPYYRKSGRKVTSNPDGHGCYIDEPSFINPKLFPPGFSTKIIHDKPYIVKIRRFLDSNEIKILLGMAKGLFEKSTIVVDGKMVKSTTRSSRTAFITDNGHYNYYDDGVNNILDKVCYLTSCDRTQIEGLMVVKYREGDEYQEHHDYFKEEHQDVIADGGNRIGTFFVYLNSLEPGEGGETEFPEIGVKAKPSKGTAVFWWDTDSKGDVIPSTLHRGNPVLGKNKTKYGLNIWIREGSFY